MISSITWCPTRVGSFRCVPHKVQVNLYSGALVISICLGFGLVMPAWSLSLPGKRLVFFVWSPLRVGYIFPEEGCGGFVGD